MRENNTDSKIDLSIYRDFGSYKFVMTYRGRGSIALPNGTSLTCQFECGQVVNGKIICACLFEEPMDLETCLYMSSINLNNNAYISGHSEEGQEIRVTIDFLKNSSYGNIISAIFIARDLVVTDTDEAEINEITFYLTNFLFMYESLVWNNLDDRYSVTIQKVEHYDDIERALQAIRGIGITAKMSITASDVRLPFDESYVVDMATDICSLLSLAKGCKIQWLYSEATSANEQSVKRYHWRPKITPYGGHDLIHENPGEDIDKFLSQTFPAFRRLESVGKLGRTYKMKRKKIWKLDEAIGHFVDSVMEEDFLELRGLKLVTLAEYLTNRYSWMQDKQYVIKPCFFDVKIELLKKSIKDVVVDTFNLDPTSPISDRMVTHVSMLNRYSFSKRLRELLKGIYLDVEYKETRRFIDIRDRLVHDARFLKQGEGQNTESNIEQYHRVLTFIGRMMLGLLEYDGHYHDWTKYTPGEWAGPEAKQRVMMVYSKKKGR